MIHTRNPWLPLRGPTLRTPAVCLAVAVICLLGMRVPLHAATIPYRTDGELVAISHRVVHGRVLAVWTEMRAEQPLRTVARIAVLEDLTGVDDPVIDVRELGGEAGEVAMMVPGSPRFLAGQQVLLCLERSPAGGYRTVAMSFSTFTLQPQAGGEGALQRYLGTVEVLNQPAWSERARTLSQFRQIVSAVKGSAPVRPQGTQEMQPEPARAVGGARIEAPFTYFGIRWHEADSGGAIQWFWNPDRNHPLTSGNIDTEMQIAAAAWTSPPTASVALTYNGTRSAGGGTDVTCISANAGGGLVSFEDPANTIGTGVLALGGGCYGGVVRRVNGVDFANFTNGFVVFNDAASLGGFYRVPPNFTRVLTHEIGHGVGLGHPCGNGTGITCTTAMRANLMYPSCCFAEMPVPPAIGPDDRAGLEFIYPVGPSSAPPCTYGISPTSSEFGPTGGSGEVDVTTGPNCTWTASSTGFPWISVSPSSDIGVGSVAYTVQQNTGPPRTGTLSIAGQTFSVTQGADQDADSLPDDWETRFGLSPGSNAAGNGASGDPDGDGVTNLQEYHAGTHPRGFFTRYLAEGAVNDFFQTELAVLNPGATQASTLVRVLPEQLTERSYFLLTPARARRTIATGTFRTLSPGAFSMIVESDVALVVDRTMSWGAGGYGAHAETSQASPGPQWFLAEGATTEPFTLFYLLQNPGAAAVDATVRFLKPSGAPVVQAYRLPPHSRTTIPVDDVPGLANTEVSASITATGNILVERAMYLSWPGQPFFAGHSSSGVTTTSSTWFLAEGATGPFFDLFVLIANPNPSEAQVTVDYLLQSGQTLSKEYRVNANGRLTIFVDDEEFPQAPGTFALANESLSATIRCTSCTAGTGIIVERAMWWPRPAWYEAHNSPGTTLTGTQWALAAGEVGGPQDMRTYVLVANTSAFSGLARVTLLFEDGTTAQREYALLPSSRTNVPVKEDFAAAAGRRFSAIIDSVAASGQTPAQIVVERAMYWSPNGQPWGAGTAAVATRLTP